MLKSLKLCRVVFIAAMLTFALSFSAMLIKESTAESVTTEEVVVLSINGMHCGGCAGKVKAALSACKGVTDVQVSFEDSKASVHVEDGTDTHVLIEAVKKLGYKVTEG